VQESDSKNYSIINPPDPNQPASHLSINFEPKTYLSTMSPVNPSAIIFVSEPGKPDGGLPNSYLI
jgi:hypothetical protein